MTLRELIIARIQYAVSDEQLMDEFMVDADQLDELSDVDLFELFEDVILETN